MVLGDASQQLGPSLLILGRFFFLGMSLGLDMKWAGLCQILQPHRYNLICAPFVGVNHHWQNVIFGYAFLLDETVVSFKWLFKSFLDSMGNLSPITIFTDQDQAMSNVIEEVFLNTHHRLCLWHISKNAPSYFGELNSNSEFQSLWNEFQKYCDSKLEFQNTWDKIMHKFNLEDHC